MNFIMIADRQVIGRNGTNIMGVNATPNEA